MANSTPDSDTINFNIIGPGPYNLFVSSSSITEITAPLVIDGFTQPGNDSSLFSVKLFIYNGFRIKSSHCMMTGLNLIEDSTFGQYGEGMIVDFSNIDPVDSILIYKNRFQGFYKAICMGSSGFNFLPTTNLIFQSNSFINNNYAIDLLPPSSATQTTDFYFRNNYFFKSALYLSFQLLSVPNNINIEQNRFDSSRVEMSGNMSLISFKDNQLNSASYFIYDGSVYNLSLINNQFGKNHRGFIFNGYGSDLEVYGNRFDSSNTSGISFGAYPNSLRSVNVKNNQFINCGGVGLTMAGSLGHSAYDINIIENDFYKDSSSWFNPMVSIRVFGVALLDGINIKNNIFDGGTISVSAGSNVGVSRIKNLNVSGNTIIGNTRLSHGVEIEGDAGYIENISIDSNIISKSRNGIMLQTSSYSGYSATIRNVRIASNTIFENYSSGIIIFNHPDNSNAKIDSVVVDSNIVSMNGKDGIEISCIENSSSSYVNRLTNIELRENTVNDNNKQGIHFYEIGTPSTSFTSAYFSNITFSRNSIFDNGQKGIWIENFYDPQIPMTPIFPFPEITSIVNTGLNKTIFGHIQGDSLCDYKIEVFGNNFPDSSGYGEGQYFIGDIVCSTDSTGYAAIQYLVTNVNSDYYSLTATSLLKGNTSVFSNIGDSTVNLSELNHNGFKIYPNPFNNNFSIFTEEIVSLKIYDLFGKIISEKLKVSGEITFGENISAGNYFLEIFNGEERKTFTLVKTK